jgi:hypothetical protein
MPITPNVQNVAVMLDIDRALSRLDLDDPAILPILYSMSDWLYELTIPLWREADLERQRYRNRQSRSRRRPRATQRREER